MLTVRLMRFFPPFPQKILPALWFSVLCAALAPAFPLSQTSQHRLWRAEHPEFEQIVFHSLRHSSATYQLLQSDGYFKSVQGNTGHATASVLKDTCAHTQDKPPAGIDRENRSELLFPRPDPGSTPTPAKRKAGGNKNLR